MDNSVNVFKKYLIDEIKSKSNADYVSILKEVNSYSQTPDFDLAFNKWSKVQGKRFIKSGGPRKVGDILR